MAKKTTAEVKKEEKEEPKIYIDLATSEEDVVAYDAAGVMLIFNKKRFRRLSRENLEALSYENRQGYLKTQKIIEEEEEAKRPLPRAKIIDPLGTHEGALLTPTITDKAWEKKWHLCWKYANEAEALGKNGYSRVVAGEDPVECGLKPAGTSFLLADPRSRTDLDLILMKVPMHLYLQHQTAVAAASTDKIKGYKDQFNEEVAEQSNGRLRGKNLEEEPTEKAVLSRSDLKDMPK
jgi:hypothetical protein